MTIQFTPPRPFRAAMGGLLLMAISSLAVAAATDVRVLDLRSGTTQPMIHIRHGKKVTSVDLVRLNLSAPIKITQTDGKLFAADLPEQLGDDRLATAASSVTLRPEWSRVILIVFPNSVADLPFRIHAINASPGVFPKAGVHLANLTKSRVSGRLGTRAFQMEAASMLLVQPPIERNGDYPVVIDHVADGSRQVRPLVRGTWRREPDARQLVFIVPDAQRQVPRVFSIPDFDPTPISTTSSNQPNTEP